MPRHSLQVLLLAGLLLSAGCNRPVSRSIPATAPSVATPSPITTAAPESVNFYQQALDRANSAKNFSQSALSEDDWNLVASRWQQAIASLKAVPPSSPYQPLVKAKLTEFAAGFAAARKRATQAKTLADKATPGTLARGEALNVTSAIAAAPSAGKVFQAPIKRRAGGTPIIDVAFNGNQTFEMIVDTGASGTVITQAMATALNVRVIGKTKVNTASQTGVEVPLAYVDSIAVSGAVVKEVVVAIANDALDVGLLGHDFFGDFDVTVKQNVVEFRKR